jgi:23S rRNA (cytosine1962-C5)-methyltransferase
MGMSLVLAPGREKSLLRRHPWIFTGALAPGHTVAAYAPGSVVDVVDAQGVWRARAGVSPASQICARVWTFDPQEEVTKDLVCHRLEKAVLRRRLRPDFGASTAWRYVFSESDGLPGLIVDGYASTLVFQIVSAGMEPWRQAVVDTLSGLFPEHGIMERSDAAVRAKEGLKPRVGAVRGAIPPLVPVEEHGITYLVDVWQGHKTGMYLDQRENRQKVRAVAAGRRVLNCFAYTGGFGLAALAGGATEVTQVDTSAAALQLAQRHAQIHGWTQVSYVQTDVFALLRHKVQAGERYDLIILDPPKFVESKGSLPRGCRGYKDINYWALRLLSPGGHLFTFSCSGLVDAGLFQKIVADAALDAGVEAQIVDRLGQAGDHPVLLSFPEAAYLKGLHLTI